MAVEFNIDGQPYRFPDWATESTQTQILAILQSMAKKNGADATTLKAIEQSNSALVKQLKDDSKSEKSDTEAKAKADKELKKAVDDITSAVEKGTEATQQRNKEDSQEYKTYIDKVIDNLESDGEQLLGTIGSVTWGLGKFSLFVGGALLTGATYVGNKLFEAGTTINEMTKAGVGFSSMYADAGKGTTEAVAGLGALGVGFRGAAQMMINSSSVIATQGFGRFEETMKFAADTSEELGLSFEDSMQRFGDALNRRQQLLNLGSVNQQRLNQQVQKTTKLQQAFSTALGVGTAEMQNFIDGLLDQNGLLVSSMLRFNDTVRNDVVAGIEVFASGLAAYGGKAGQEIATAFTEAAAAGSVGLSEAAIGMVTALPNLKGPMDQYINAIQSGTLSQDEAKEMVDGMTRQLGNLSDSEKERIRLLARTGDASAQSMANAIAQFEQSESKIKEINKALGTGFDMDLVQKGRNEFAKTMSQISGGFENAFYSLFADPSVTKALMDGVKEIMGVFGFATDDMSGMAQDAGGMVKGLVKKFVPVIKSITDTLVVFAEFIKEEFEEGGIGGVISAMMGKVVSAGVKALLKALPLFMIGLFGFSMAKQAYKQFIVPQLQNFTATLFSKGADLAKKVGQTALGFAKNLFDPKNSGAVSKFLQGAAGKIKGGIQSAKDSSFGQKAAEKLGSFQKDGAKMTDKLSSSVSGGGKSGGFLKSIADGVKKFGDNKVVKGAASLVLLGAAIGVAAIGLKQFNEVDFTSIVKGTIALAGLAGLAQMLGKGSTAMMKGAAAVAILGAAIVPMAFGLNLMKDVGLKTIGVMAAGLVVLGIAAAGLGLALPFILMGAVAIGALGIALIPFGLALNLVAMALPTFTESMDKMATIDGGGLLKAAGGMLAIAGAMALMAPLLPFMLLGSLAAPSIERMGVALQSMNGVDFGNLALAGKAMAALGLGMVALTGGSLLSGVAEGIGKLFGAESPSEKIKRFADELSGVETEPLIKLAEGLTSIVDSARRSLEAAAALVVFGEAIGPFVRKISNLTTDLMILGDDPFKPFKMIDEHAEAMQYFGSSMDTVSNALNNIDGDYISDQFLTIGDSISYMADSLDQINMGDMLKLGAMKLLGPSKAEQQEEAQQDAVKSVAFDKLHGDDMMSGLTGIMDNLQQEQGKGGYRSMSERIFDNMPALQAAGIGVDTSAIRGEKGTEGFSEESSRIMQTLQKQIDMFKMQAETGIVAPTGTSNAFGSPTAMPGIEGPAVAQNTTDTQNTTQGTTPTAPTPEGEDPAMANMSNTELMEKLVSLQAENNRLLAKNVKATGDLNS